MTLAALKNINNILSSSVVLSVVFFHQTADFSFVSFIIFCNTEFSSVFLLAEGRIPIELEMNSAVEKKHVIFI